MRILRKQLFSLIENISEIRRDFTFAKKPTFNENNIFFLKTIGCKYNVVQWIN